MNDAIRKGTENALHADLILKQKLPDKTLPIFRFYWLPKQRDVLSRMTVNHCYTQQVVFEKTTNKLKPTGGCQVVL